MNWNAQGRLPVGEHVTSRVSAAPCFPRRRLGQLEHARSRVSATRSSTSARRMRPSWPTYRASCSSAWASRPRSGPAASASAWPRRSRSRSCARSPRARSRTAARGRAGAGTRARTRPLRRATNGFNRRRSSRPSARGRGRVRIGDVRGQVLEVIGLELIDTAPDTSRRLANMAGCARPRARPRGRFP